MSKRGNRGQGGRRSQPAQAINAEKNRDSANKKSSPTEPLIPEPTNPQAAISPNEDQTPTKIQEINSGDGPNDRLLVRYTKSLRNWTVGLVLVGFLTVGVLSLQWSTFEKTDQTLKAEQRPWVSLKSMDVVSDLIWMPDGAHLDIHFALKNTGHSPAVRAVTNSKAFVMFGREPNPQTAQTRLCDETRKNNIGDAIFPGDFVIQPQTLFFDRSDIDIALKTAPVKTFIPMILICVNYRFTGEGPTHQTSYIFTLKRKPYTNAAGIRSVGINIDETLVATEIDFERFLVGFDAD